MSRFNKTYSEMKRFQTYQERLDYLKLNGSVGFDTFGSRRWLNQKFYRSPEWLSFRDEIITRDRGCDMGLEGYDLNYKIYIHHINPVTFDDIANRNLDLLLNPENAVCVSFQTHQAIHYGDESTRMLLHSAERSQNDTIPWK